MAGTFVYISATNPDAQAFRQCVAQLAQVWGNLQNQAAKLTAMVGGTDYTEIETVLGLQAGQGVTVYNLTTGANAAVNVSAVTQLINGVG